MAAFQKSGRCKGGFHLQKKEQKQQEVWICQIQIRGGCLRARKEARQHCFGLRMYVNIPKYGKERSGMTLSTARGKQYVKQYEDENRGTYPSTKQPVPSGLNRGSFADAVVGRNSRVDQRKPPTNEDYLCHSLRSSVQLDIPLSGQKWLHEAWVGRLKNLALFDRVEEDILWDLGVNISLKYIGGDMILLLGLTKEQARQMMDAKNEGGDSLFHTLEKWSPQMRSGYRLTWVQC